MDWNYGYGYHDYYSPHDSYYYAPDVAGDTVFAVIGIGILVLFVLAISLALYLVQAFALYKISKNRGYRYAWLAFIPFANTYVLGGVADNINACYGRKSSWRVWLLVLQILGSVFGFFTGLSTSLSIIGEYAVSFSDRLFAAGILPMLLTWAAGVASTVLTYIVLYKIFRDYSNLAPLYLVLSIFFNVTQPFFLFVLRNKPSASLAYRNQFFQAGTAPAYGVPPVQPAPSAAPVEPTPSPEPAPERPQDPTV